MSRPDDSGWMITYTGRRVWPLDPVADDIDIRLARQLPHRFDQFRFLTPHAAGTNSARVWVSLHCYWAWPI